MICCDNIPRAFTPERLCTFLRVSGPSACAFLPSCMGGRGTNPCNLNDWQTPPGCDLVPARHNRAAGPTRSLSLMLPIVYVRVEDSVFWKATLRRAAPSQRHLSHRTLSAGCLQRTGARTYQRKASGQLFRSYFSNTQMKEMLFVSLGFIFPWWNQNRMCSSFAGCIFSFCKQASGVDPLE